MNADLATFLYNNHRGEVSFRTVRPIRIWFGSTAWHTASQWFMEAFDLDKLETRDFALSGFFGGWGSVKTEDEQTEIIKLIKQVVELTRRVNDAESGNGPEPSKA